MKYLWCLFLIFILIFRYISSEPHYQNGQILKVSGHVLSEPTTSYGNIKFNLSNILVTTKETNIHYGDFVTIEGIYKNGELTKTKINELSSSNNFLINIRRKIVDFYKSVMKEPNASLIAGITIGAKSTLPRNFSNNLNKTGTSHIVVASGTNITIFAGFVTNLLILKIKRQKALIITIIFIWIYTFIAGFDAPIIRAAVMATIAFTGIILGKVGNTLKFTLLTGYIMLFFVPTWIKDVGFLLSFATTISLILFQSKITKLIYFVPEVIKEDLATSITAQIGAIPIIFFFFGNINLLSPFINLLVLWMIPIIMIIGGLSGLISLVSPELAKPILLLSYPLTAWFISVVNFFSKI
jgi:competence protein ComEC